MNEEDKKEAADALKVALTNKAGRGYLVVTATGKMGRTYHTDELVNGKQPVYLEGGGKLLCDPKKLTFKGFID